jgi:hypothetical protein
VATRKAKAVVPPEPETHDTERAPPPFSDEQLQQLKLVDELTARMVRRGVRRISYGGRYGETIEIELDPAAQYLNPMPEELPAEPKRVKPVGECSVEACEKMGGWLGTPHCREHFHAELRGSKRTR